jgi:hypothetical protein
MDRLGRAIPTSRVEARSDLFATWRIGRRCETGSLYRAGRRLGRPAGVPRCEQGILAHGRFLDIPDPLVHSGPHPLVGMERDRSRERCQPLPHLQAIFSFRRGRGHLPQRSWPRLARPCCRRSCRRQASPGRIVLGSGAPAPWSSHLSPVPCGKDIRRHLHRTGRTSPPVEASSGEWAGHFRVWWRRRPCQEGATRKECMRNSQDQGESIHVEFKSLLD